MGSNGTEIKLLTDDSVRRIVAEQAITTTGSVGNSITARQAYPSNERVKSSGGGIAVVPSGGNRLFDPNEEAPVTATVLGRAKLIGDDAPGYIQHVLLKLPQGFHYVKGQSLSVIPPASSWSG